MSNSTIRGLNHLFWGNEAV